MSLFDHVVRAVNNPELQANTGQVGNILQVVNQLSSQQGLDSSTTQMLMTVVGQHVRTALNQQRSQTSQAQAESLVDRYSGTQANLDAVRSLFTPKEEAETVQDAARNTGLDAQQIQRLLPIVVPVVLQFLKLGSNQRSGAGGNNAILSAFLDADGDGDTDVGDALSVAGRFLQNL
ncbi:DUF937 domain-containing protein [Oscillatoria sp. CS-180]|uniref:DUF937 domain-containing protein n=1 Tax=Oscillatoria sp. CS-180 TaxID=3021720 RepID=UPI00232BDE3B|nr:DUF937 domain-containing protein [Oscillatoria sp. CS-180]MDB9524720.1 DUF937 domain-containing protein [Oscillatoria sp. CS-180]